MGADLTALARLEVLNLSGNYLIQFPAAVLELPELRKLDLSTSRYGRACSVGKLPETLDRLQKLETLELMDQELGSLPEALRRMPKLKVLDLVIRDSTRRRTGWASWLWRSSEHPATTARRRRSFAKCANA